MKEYNLYRVFCSNENCYLTTWNEIEPKACPNNYNHVLDCNKTVLMKKSYDKDSDYVNIREEVIATQGLFRSEFITYDIPNTSNVSIEKQFKYPVNILSLNYKTNTENIGDTLNTYIKPSTIIGFITSNVNVGESNVYVDDNTLRNVKRGLLYHIYNPATGNTENLGEIMNIDFLNNKITTEYSSSNLINSNSYSKIKVHIIKNHDILDENTWDVGQSKIGATFINSNMIVEFDYMNSNSQEKKLQVQIQYYY